jgi:hypothetical protein
VEALDGAAFDEQWANTTDQIKAKGVVVNPDGRVGMKFVNGSGSSSSKRMLDVDGDENLLDDIWGCRLKANSGKNAILDSGDNEDKEKDKADKDKDKEVTAPKFKRKGTTDNIFGLPPDAGAPQTSAGPQIFALKMLLGGNAGAAKAKPQKQLAVILKELNKGDAIMLEAQQAIDAMKDSTGIFAMTTKQMSSVKEKLEGRLSAEVAQIYNADWQPGEPETRGVKLTTDLKTMQKLIVAAEKLVGALQAVVCLDVFSVMFYLLVVVIRSSSFSFMFVARLKQM